MAPKTAKEKRDARDARLRDEGARTAVERLNLAATIHPDQVPSSTGEVAKPQSAGDKVVVGCKLGVALYDIQLMRMDTKFEQNMQGGREVSEATRVGNVVRLRGTAYPRGTPPEGFPPPPLIVEGAALNFGIDRHFMEKWIELNKLNPVVMNKMVFICPNIDAAQGFAKETAKLQSGLEPINPKGDARIPRSTRKDEVMELEPGQRPR